MQTPVYLRDPDFQDNHLVFVCDDDIWKVEYQDLKTLAAAKTLASVRLTNSSAQARNPKISPKGDHVAYVSNESGERDIYLISSKGGTPKRLTYKGDVHLIGWNQKGHILYGSEAGHFMATTVYEIATEATELQSWNFGECYYIHSSAKGDVVARNMRDIAVWKNYCGGDAGQIWVKQKGKKAYQRLLTHIRNDIGAVCSDGKSIYFLCDKDGIGNVYAMDYSGKNIQQITHQKPFYIRSYAVHKQHILYASAGDLWLQPAKSSKARKLAITVHSSFDQARPRYISAEDYTTQFACSHHGAIIATIVRGSLYTMRPWVGGSRYVEKPKNITRYRNIYPFANKRDFMAIGVDTNGEDRLVQCKWQTKTESYSTSVLPPKNHGKIYSFLAADDGTFMLYSTLRHELWLLYSKKPSSPILLAKSDIPMDGFDISPDKKWIVYSTYNHFVGSIFVYSLKSKKTTPLIRSYGDDFSPAFDPKDNLLYFLSTRDYEPVYADGPNDLTFFSNVKPYVVYLDAHSPSLKHRRLRFKDPTESSEESEQESVKSKKSASAKKKQSKKSTTKSSKPISKTTIDFENIDQRIHPLPLAAGGWWHIYACEDKIFFRRSAHSHSSDDPQDTGSSYMSRNAKIYSYQKSTGAVNFCGEIHKMILSGSRKYFLVSYYNSLSLISSDEKSLSDDDDRDKPKSIDLSRVRHRIDPQAEWQQMLQEAWYLQKENFNNPIRHIAFDQVLTRYSSIVSKVKTRAEFSDLLRDMQGELQTSHCYEYYGDYHSKPTHLPTARLGADLRYIKSKRCYRIERVYIGESWNSQNHSPLMRSGVSLKKGDEIHCVGGLPFSKPSSLDEYLENKAGTTVELRVRRANKKSFENLTVLTLSRFSYLSYYNWRYKHREYVRKLSKDRVGYLHVPDMQHFGLSEFYKHYMIERQYPHLIIDMRYNRGGFISGTLISYLTTKSIATGGGKWQTSIESYPRYSAPQSMVCLINGGCGSDGDMFAQAFKDLELGKLIGTRTWGGVIGIWPRVTLVDGTETTQPEYDTVFTKNNLRLENEGTEPDIPLELSPDDYAQDRDRQLELAVTTLLASGAKKDKTPKTTKGRKKMIQAKKRNT